MPLRFSVDAAPFKRVLAELNLHVEEDEDFNNSVFSGQESVSSEGQMHSTGEKRIEDVSSVGLREMGLAGVGTVRPVKNKKIISRR